MLRVLVLLAIATATVWFGVTFGPVQSVRADIYMKLASAYQKNPDAVVGQVNGRGGVALMNSSKVYYRVFQSLKSVHEVLDDYERSMVPIDSHLLAGTRFPVSMNLQKIAPEIPFLEFVTNRSRVVRDESASWGYLSFLDLGLGANRDWHAALNKKTQMFAKTKRLGDLGIARTIIAVPSPTSKQTTVMSYWTDPDFSLSAFEDNGRRDLPGKDVEGLPRFDPLRRLITFDHVEDKLGFLLVMYETPLLPTQAIALFDQKAQGAGWRSRIWQDPGRKLGEILFLRRGAAEVQVFARRDQGKSYVLVSRRTLD